MSDGIVIIGSGFAARQLVKNIRKQDAQIPLTLIAADSMDEYNKPYLNWRPDQATNEKRLKRMSAGITLLLGVLLLLAAWRPPEMIIWLNLLAFGGLEAVFLWPLVLGL